MDSLTLSYGQEPVMKGHLSLSLGGIQVSTDHADDTFHCIYSYWLTYMYNVYTNTENMLEFNTIPLIADLQPIRSL